MEETPIGSANGEEDSGRRKENWSVVLFNVNGKFETNFTSSLNKEVNEIGDLVSQTVTSQFTSKCNLSITFGFIRIFTGPHDFLINYVTFLLRQVTKN